MEKKGVQCGGPANFVGRKFSGNEYKLYNSPDPEGYVFFLIPSLEEGPNTGQRQSLGLGRSRSPGKCRDIFCFFQTERVVP